MNDTPRLSQTITADVAADGSLLRADEAVLELHKMAGGIEGGVLAVPGLASVARATHRIKMRLARVVQVANDDDNFELWVESRFESGPSGDIAKLSITGWRTIAAPAQQSHAQRDQQIEDMEAHIELLFDPQSRLVSASGDILDIIGDPPIGQTASQIFVSRDAPVAQLLDAIENRKAVRMHGVSLNDSGPIYSAFGDIQTGKGGEFSGYVCELRKQGTDDVPVDDQPAKAEPLFGQQLAPVLRQPLGRIIANAETIGGKLHGPIRENYATYAKDIADAARHLVALVDDLGDLEAIERPGFSTAQDAIELGDLARRVAGLLALKAADHRISIITPSEDVDVPATAEFRRVLQILINLVTNAVRYSPDGTSVTLAAQMAGDMAELTVSDEGTGIDPADHEKIFEKFERLGRSGDGGSGLGLYISRRLARAMGGDLAVTRAEQGGAKFTLTLPARS